MHATLPDPASQPAKRNLAAVKIFVGVIGFVILAVILWLVLVPQPARRPATAPAIASAQMTPAELDYLKNIQVANITLSRAENFIHQEVTIVNGEIFNSGNATVSGLRLTAQFTDELNQVVLRETRDAMGAPDPPLAPGERRAFEISFEHLPASWNMQQPQVRASALHLVAR